MYNKINKIARLVVLSTYCNKFYETEHSIIVYGRSGGMVMEQFKTKQEQMRMGDDGMSNAVVKYSAIDLQSLMGKKCKIISSEKALKDVKPIEWEEEILRGEKRVIATKKE